MSKWTKSVSHRGNVWTSGPWSIEQSNDTGRYYQLRKGAAYYGIHTTLQRAKDEAEMIGKRKSIATMVSEMTESGFIDSPAVEANDESHDLLVFARVDLLNEKGKEKIFDLYVGEYQDFLKEK